MSVEGNNGGPAPEPFVDVQIAARFLGVKPSWLYDQIRAKTSLPSYKLGALRRFRLSELARWVEARRDDH